ncbi:MAG: MFS transporter PPP family 3-phenylpropionic acid transporter [Comamonadaceae bacterium]|nr:MAG: MFS transporter PPP family 3-phenylpropionic acid transporter [Comamonadaceae bacterium]
MPNAAAHLIAFGALSASYFAHIGFFNPYLPLWLKDLGLSVFDISLLIAVQSATRLLAPYAWGAVSDHTGERVKLLRLGAGVALFSSLGLFFDLGFWWLAAVLLLMFTHTSFMMPMSEAAMAHLVSSGGAFDAHRYGRVRLWGSLGFLVTVLLAGSWFEAFGMAHFPLWTALTLLAVGPVLRSRPVQWLFASMFFHVLAHMSIYVFFSLYMDHLGYSKTVIGLLWAVSVLAEIVWFFTQSRWLPRLSLSGWLLLCAAARAGAGANAARHHLRRASLGVYCPAVTPLPGSPARPRPGAVHRGGLWFSWRAGQRGGWVVKC